MKGIILAGGAGSRMYPTSLCYSKQLVMIYDKPMIYYPLSTLMLSGIREILIISNAETIPFYQKLFGDGSHLGLKISYKAQPAPKGIAEAFILGKEFIGKDDVTLILGDNIFYGNLDFLREALRSNRGATVFGYYVNDPQRYGVVEFDANGKAVSLEEKPLEPKSNYAVVGLYVYNNEVVSIARELKPSARGELEITDLNKVYLERGDLDVQIMGRGVAWLDTGTPQALLEVSQFIGAIEKRQGLKVGCVEEVAYLMNYIDRQSFQGLIAGLPVSDYRSYLETIERNELIHTSYQG
ncbi:MAG: glucose-1-phosphate thymidylyltransferase RfbA [Candidatus Cloacimonetes bacterium]|nr:glucose-1-phosphate thymidylyltransferase RfbA [Candidatus Cloacimonadota bacterium]